MNAAFACDGGELLKRRTDRRAHGFDERVIGRDMVALPKPNHAEAGLLAFRLGERDIVLAGFAVVVDVVDRGALDQLELGLALFDDDDLARFRRRRSDGRIAPASD